MRIFWPFMFAPMTHDRGRTTEDGNLSSHVITLALARRPSVLCLLCYRDHHAGADGLAALADGEALLLLHGDGRDQLNVHGRVVARHDHLRPRRQRALPGHVGGAEVKLRTVVVEERRMPAALLLGQDVGLRLELLVRLHRARLAQHLTALDVLLRYPAQQAA